jgi:hypothetical protein
MFFDWHCDGYGGSPEKKYPTLMVLFINFVGVLVANERRMVSAYNNEMKEFHESI